jgi:hypothetical protein
MAGLDEVSGLFPDFASLHPGYDLCFPLSPVGALWMSAMLP